MSSEVCSKSITREDLYQRVWTTPIRHLAKEFGLSDVGLSKLCRRHSIPTPPVGYWAKRAHGKHVRRPRLPASGSEDDNVISFKEVAAPKVNVPLSATFFDPELGRLAQEDADGPPISIPKTLRSLHPVVARTVDAVKASTIATYRLQGNLIPAYSQGDELIFEVCTSKSLSKRALRILDVIVKESQRRGYEIVPAEEKWRAGPRVEAFGLQFGIKLREITRRVQRELTKDEKEDHRQYPNLYPAVMYEFVPTGVLQLELSRWSCPLLTLRDGKTRHVEDGLRRVFLQMLRRVDEHRKRKAVEAEEEARQREAERVRRQAEELRRQEEIRQQEELAKVNQLIDAAKRWETCKRVKRYLAVLRTIPATQHGGVANEKWFLWADSVVAKMNPVGEFMTNCNVPTKPR